MTSEPAEARALARPPGADGRVALAMIPNGRSGAVFRSSADSIGRVVAAAFVGTFEMASDLRPAVPSGFVEHPSRLARPPELRSAGQPLS